MTTRSFFSVFALTTMVALMISGCDRQGGHAPESSSSVFAEALQDARQHGASETQLGILERARDKNVLTLADVQEALDASFACMDAAGIGHSQDIVTDVAGFQYISYTMQQGPGLSVDDLTEISDQCVAENSGTVEHLYMEQPTVVEAIDRYNHDVVLPRLTTCFTDYGIAYDADGTWNELWDQAFYVIKDDPSSKPGDPTAAGCLLDASMA